MFLRKYQGFVPLFYSILLFAIAGANEIIRLRLQWVAATKGSVHNPKGVCSNTLYQQLGMYQTSTDYLLGHTDEK